MKNKIILLGYGFLGIGVHHESKKRELPIITTKLNEKNGIIQLDITDHNKIEKLIETEKPELVINCIGRTDIDYIEKNPKLAIEINSIGPKFIAKNCKKNGSRFIHISTDSIFDGVHGMYAEDDIPNPQNLYAKTKLDGEKNISENCDDFAIIRTNFYGINNSTKYLFNTMLKKLYNKNSVVGFSDVYFSPLSVENLSEQILDVGISNFKGIIHLGADTKLSKYEFCLLMAQKLGFNEDCVKPDSIDNYSFIAKRPKNTSLDNKLSKSIVKHKSIEFNDWLEIKKDEIIQLFNLKNM
jgi:dTDP-4-dehydrorhamnose reductase